MVMEWCPFENGGLVGCGSIGSLSYHRVHVTARHIQGRSMILICAMATVLRGCNGACLCTCVCVYWEWCTRSCSYCCFFLFVQCMHFFGYFVNSAPVRMCIYTANCLVPQHCADLCWQWYTVGFLRATGVGEYTQWIIHHTHWPDL